MGRSISFLGIVLWMACLFLIQGPMAFSAGAEGKKELLPLGSPAPDFHLKDVVSGKVVSRDDFTAQKALLVVFLCRHCPYVQHDKAGIIQLAKDYAAKNVGIVTISANDPAAYPEDAPDKLKEMAVKDGFPIPLLFDETQEVARTYTAVATPDFFLFDQNRKLVYRGQFDDSRPHSKIPVTGKDVRTVLDSVLEGKAVPLEQKPSVGCSIKWKR